MKNKAGLIVKSFEILGISLVFIVLSLSFISIIMNGSRIFEIAIGGNPPGYIVIPRFVFGQIKTLLSGVLMGLAYLGGAQMVIIFLKRRGREIK